MSELEKAVDALRRGGIVVFPTETVYGLGANAFDAEAVAGIYNIKKRPLDHPLIVHALNIEQVKELVLTWPDKAERLAKKFWPGPLTLVLPKHPSVPDIVTAGLPTVAIRVPAHPIAQELIATLGFPIAAPSANLFGMVSPTRPEHVFSLKGKADFILEGGACEVGLESTILSFEESLPVLLRPGGITREEIEDCLGSSITLAKIDAKPVAPGMLPRHYAPKTPILFVKSGDALPQARLGLLCLDDAGNVAGFESIIRLSSKKDLREAAAKFFSSLRQLDEAGLDYIVAYRFPDVGLGVAINDRLRRASYHSVVGILPVTPSSPAEGLFTAS
jgi:L-threonylcarbamoyladenylate synthase